MTAEVFLDTNILLYACSAAEADAGKQSIAGKLILETDFALSAQVLQDFIAISPTVGRSSRCFSSAVADISHCLRMFQRFFN